jgi:hypothetical protein
MYSFESANKMVILLISKEISFSVVIGMKIVKKRELEIFL